MSEEETDDDDRGTREQWHAHYLTRKRCREAWASVDAAQTALIAAARTSSDPTVRHAIAAYDERTRAAMVLGKRPKERS